LRQVAEKAGIDHAALARLESSHKVSAVHPATLKGLAGAYDIPLAELLRHVGYEIITPDTSTYLHQCYPCLPETAIAAVRAHIERLVARYDADAKATASSPDAP
jgi:transcriptional regulator with XRE-family HTH domain